MTTDKYIDSFGSISLYSSTIRKGFTTKPLTGVTCTMTDGSPQKSRVTATRLLLLGVFALAAPKRKGGEKWLSVSGPDFVWTEKVGPKEVKKAQRFMLRCQQAAKAYDHGSETAAAASDGGDPASEVAKLAQLHDQGVLSDAEFDAAKKKALGL